MKRKPDGKTVLIVTHSRKGFTDNVTTALVEGVEQIPNVKAAIKRINEVQPSDLADADALVIGSPTYLSYISGELKDLLDNTFYKFTKAEKTNRLEGKPGAAFVSGRYKGYRLKKLQFKSTVLKQLERILFGNLKMKKVVDGMHLIHNIKSRDPRAPLPLTPEQKLLCKNMGRKLAEEIAEWTPSPDDL